MNYKLNCFSSEEKAVSFCANTLFALSHTSTPGPCHIALSGGSTPERLYRYLVSSSIGEEIDWSRLHFWWGDERCLPPESPESNFGNAYRTLFHPLEDRGLDGFHLHRIHGEDSPSSAAAAYGNLLCSEIMGAGSDSFPVLDWILLGIGEDGHTASLFPAAPTPRKQSLCLVSKHPDSGQKRISMSAELIYHARRISFLVLGEHKREILHAIIDDPLAAERYPAADILYSAGNAEIICDCKTYGGAL